MEHDAQASSQTNGIYRVALQRQIGEMKVASKIPDPDPWWVFNGFTQSMHHFLMQVPIVRLLQIGLIASGTIFVSATSLFSTAFENAQVKAATASTFEMSWRLVICTGFAALIVYGYQQYSKTEKLLSRSDKFSQTFVIGTQVFLLLFNFVYFIIAALKINNLLTS